MYGPTGVGVLYGKAELLNAMPPYQGGGDMIKKVTFAKTTYADIPQKFEAGTQSIADVIGLGTAIDFLNLIDMDKIAEHEKSLLKHALKKMNKIKELRIIGDTLDKVDVISFVLEKIHPHDIATILDSEGIAVRAGNHCNMPLMEHFKISGTTRISFGMYNTEKEIDLFIDAVIKVQNIFAK